MSPSLLDIANAEDPVSDGAEDLVPNGTSDSLFDSLVERYRTFAKKSAENIIQLAETLVEAKAKLSGMQLHDFCQAVGLDQNGSKFRKRLTIGQEASRFEPYVDRLPTNWTTIYKLASLDGTVFDRVAKDARFAPMMTAGEVALIIAGKSNESSKRLPNDWSIHLVGCDKEMKLEVCKKLIDIADEYGFKYTFSSRLTKELMPPKVKPSFDAKDLYGGAA